MPFKQYFPRSLTPAGVNTFAPVASGIYGITNAREWLYIGETDDIRGDLLAHLQDLKTPVMVRQPTGFVFEVCDRGTRLSRQDRLILEYEPSCNRRSPQHLTAETEQRRGIAKSR